MTESVEQKRLAAANAVKAAKQENRVTDVAVLLMRYPGITKKEIGFKLDLSGPTVAKYVRILRNRWKKDYNK